MGDLDSSFDARPLEYRDFSCFIETTGLPRQIFKIQRVERHHLSEHSRFPPLQPFQATRLDVGTPKQDLQQSKEEPVLAPGQKPLCSYPAVMSPQTIPPRAGNKIFICHKAMPGQTSQDDSRIREQQQHRLDHSYCEEWGCPAHSHNTHGSKDTECPVMEEYRE